MVIRTSLIGFAICMSLFLNAYSQQIKKNDLKTHQRSIEDKGLNGLRLNWKFSGFTANEKQEGNRVFHFIRMAGFTHTKEVGKPALPCYNELIGIPQGADVSIKILKAEYKDYSNFLVYPALQPARDTKGAPEPEFEIDEDFYKTNSYYPSSLVSMNNSFEWRDFTYGVFTFHPVQYNPATLTLRVYSSLEFEVSFSGGTRFIDASQHSQHFLNQLQGLFANNTSIQNDIALQQGKSASNNTQTPDYIIITHSNFLAAAQRLAAWKQQLGYRVELISGSSWTSASVKTAVHSRYNSWNPKPDFLLLIGDHTEVPGETLSGPYGTYATDLFYVCMNGSNDYTADMAQGRISVITAAEANNVVDKIIAYETNPPTDSSFYNSSVHAAYFQHQGSGYAERRFAQTAEDLRNYMVNTQNFNVSRVYFTESNVTPLYWNNGLYSAGEPIPSYLRKPTFPWNGTATNINTAINNGVSYVLHRDHGYEQGWGDPAYVLSNVSQLNNGNKTPIVFSINCLTGKYYYGECFAERFLRKYPGGAVGVFAHAEVSYSGYNDGLSMGLIDAIWNTPGVNPVFTGSGGISNPPASNHARIFTMGDVTNHGLIRMNQTWGVSTYTNTLLTYFGDPALRIYTQKPLSIAALHQDTLMCGSDTVLSISSSNSMSGLVTLIVDGETVAQNQLINGLTNLYFPQLAGNIAILTISDTNSIPYIDTLVIQGGCPKAVFSHAANNYCLSENVVFSQTSLGNISSYTWNFGSGAIPATASGQGPHTVSYTTPGPKTVSLTVTGTQSHTSTRQFTIDALCTYKIPASGNQTITSCSGKLFDDGGNLNYSNSSSGITTISSPNSAQINLIFNSFSFENGGDMLKIFDGPGITSPLIGTYSGTSLPGVNGIIISSSGSITLQQITNAANAFAGFEAEFSCASLTSAPVANFGVSDSISCNGTIAFTDISFNSPNTWVWHFGDGDTSHLRNPQHTYLQNGSFNIKLVVSNSFGIDSAVRIAAVMINKPQPPTVTHAERCKTGILTLMATANGKINWYSTPTGGTPLVSGSTFVTPVISQTTTYYVENEISAFSQFGGKTDNAGGGGNLNAEHYLVFNCYKPMTLVSVKVYASGAGARTFQLRNSSNQILRTVNVSVPAGMSRVQLNFDVAAGNNFRLVATGNVNLYRNNAGCSYPYLISNIVSITSSSATNDPTSFYYYFYDWEIRSASCFSERTPAIATVSSTLIPVATANHQINGLNVQFNNTSSNAVTHFWDFGDGTNSSAPNPLHTFPNAGNFTVKYRAENDCGSDSLSIPISLATGITELNSNGLFKFYPNPTTEGVYMSFSIESAETFIIRVFDASGRLVSMENLKAGSGENYHYMNLKGQGAGVYMITVTGNKVFQSERLIIGI